MNIRFHEHALIRIIERGATEAEVIATIESGEQFPAKHGRQGFRSNFPFGKEWQGHTYATKQLEVFAVDEDGWLVITVIVKFF